MSTRYPPVGRPNRYSLSVRVAKRERERRKLAAVQQQARVHRGAVVSEQRAPSRLRLALVRVLRWVVDRWQRWTFSRGARMRAGGQLWQ
jgi:hypothetical protein